MYNGWTNYETWNVALYLTNEEPTYRALVEFATNYDGDRPYVDLIRHLGLAGDETADGVLWLDPLLDENELNAWVTEFVEGDDRP
jgi:hypothetical protein